MKRTAMLFCLLFLFGLTIPVLGEEPQASPQKGEVIYKTHCVGCHGLQGKGDGPDAGKLIVPPINFHQSESRNKSDRDLRSTIIWGLAFSPMHGWWGILDANDIRSVTTYIRQLAPYQPSTP